jgi:hypothetical protein
LYFACYIFKIILNTYFILTILVQQRAAVIIRIISYSVENINNDNYNNNVKMDVLDVIDDTDDENLQCEDCRFAPDLIPFHNGNKYLCSECGRIYDTELGDIAKHHMQLRSEVDDVMIAESSEPMIVNFADQYYTPKTSDNNSKKSDEFIP